MDFASAGVPMPPASTTTGAAHRPRAVMIPETRPPCVSTPSTVHFSWIVAPASRAARATVRVDSAGSP